MKKIVHYSLNVIIAIAMITMFTESSLAFNRNVKMWDATQADAIVVSKTNITFGVAASTDTFSITSAASWLITSNQTWLTITPSSGSNNGVVYVAASANTGAATRSGTITITAANTLSGTNVSKTVLVTQAAQTPTTTLNVSRTSITLSSYLAVADTFALTSNASWTLTLSSTTSGTSNTIPTWLTVTPTAGTNNAIINVAAVANTTTTARYAVVIVTSGNITKSVVISQPAAPVSTLNVSRTTIALPTYNACADTFAITANVAWTIAINGGTNSATIPTWLTVTPTSGSNNAVVNIAAVANTTTAARTAYIAATSGTLSKTITVTQAAAPIPASYLNVSRTTVALPTYNACADTFAVTSNVTWTVTISGTTASGTSNTIPTWITVTPTSGSNNAVINIATVANTTTTARYAYVVVTSGNLSKTVLVTQPAAPVSYFNVSRTTIALSTYNACTDTFTITSNVSWTIAINGGSNTTTLPTWLTVTPTTGTNDMLINIAATANTTTAARTAYIVVTSGTLTKTITVTQPATPTYLYVSRTTVALPTYNACADTFAVTSNVTWTVTISGVSTPGGITSIPTWLTVTPTSGSNNAVINIAAVANTTTAARSAYVVVTSGNLSKTVLVTQPAAPVSYLNVSRTTIALSTYNACTDTFTITSNVSWTIAINGGSNITTIPTWLTVIPTTGTNDMLINIAATANTTSTPRNAYVVVTSGNLTKTVLVTQPATPASYLNVSRASITLSTYNACTDTFAISSNVNWTITINGGSYATSIPTWLTVTPSTGSNNMIVNIAAVANTTNAARYAYLSVTSGTLSKTVLVIQPAAILPVSYLNVSRNNITIATNNACADTFGITSNVLWTVSVASNSAGSSNTVSWLTVTPASGSNNMIIQIAATSNTSTAARTAYITVSSGTIIKTIIVKQVGATVNPGLTPLANNINYNANPNNNKNIDYSVIIYPNPTKDFIVITPQQQFVNNDFVEIYSLDGRKVMTQILNGSNAKIDIQGLKNGIYFVRITQNSQVVVKTISKN